MLRTSVHGHGFHTSMLTSALSPKASSIFFSIVSPPLMIASSSCARLLLLLLEPHKAQFAQVFGRGSDGALPAEAHHLGERARAPRHFYGGMQGALDLLLGHNLLELDGHGRVPHLKVGLHRGDEPAAVAVGAALHRFRSSSLTIPRNCSCIPPKAQAFALM